MKLNQPEKKPATPAPPRPRRQLSLSGLYPPAKIPHVCRNAMLIRKVVKVGDEEIPRYRCRECQALWVVWWSGPTKDQTATSEIYRNGELYSAQAPSGKNRALKRGGKA